MADRTNDTFDSRGRPNVICLHDRTRIEAFLRSNTFLNIYQLE